MTALFLCQTFWAIVKASESREYNFSFFIAVMVCSVVVSLLLRRWPMTDDKQEHNRNIIILLPPPSKLPLTLRIIIHALLFHINVIEKDIVLLKNGETAHVNILYLNFGILILSRSSPYRKWISDETMDRYYDGWPVIGWLPRSKGSQENDGEWKCVGTSMRLWHLSPFTCRKGFWDHGIHALILGWVRLSLDW
jgi:hypothetical protein